MTEEKKLTLSGRKTLGVRTTVETGKVQQAFSHGRKKSVVVERKRKRVLRKGDEPEVKDEAPQPELEAKPEPAVEEKPAKQADKASQPKGREARQDMVREAMKRAEEERRLAEAERRKREDEAKKEEAERERLAREAREEAERAEAKAREEARRKPQKDAAKTQDVDPAAALPADADGDTQRRKGKPAKARDEQAQPKPTRSRGGERRRAGKLTVARALDDDDEERTRSLAALKRARAKQKTGGAGQSQKSGSKAPREITVPEAITVQELANRMAEKGADVVKTLMNMGMMVTINQTLDQDTAELVVTEFGHTIKRVSESDVEIGLVGDEDVADDLQARWPVVTVMGHVDHGKTSLLDAIRQADVVSGEAGGITQHIGAYQVKIPSGDKITFLDTPGHEAFTQMRARGASVTDIVILVVAADDGIMPQTIEAINHAKAADVPMIVAINKIDREGADPNKVRNMLLQHEVIVESMSGDVQEVEVSALKKTNIDKLLESIALQAELLELKSNPDRDAEGVVIEARLDKGRGPLATVLVNRGTLRVGDIFVCGAEWGRVRALIDDRGQQIKEAGPAMPVEILGLQGTPSAGDDFAVVENEARAREVSEYRQAQIRQKRTATAPASMESMFSKMKEKQAESFPVVIKGDVQGSVEAIGAALEKLSNDDIKVNVLHSAVGGITESDITLAAASEALIIGFQVRANKQARDLADKEGVPLKYYAIIYDLIDDVRAAMAGQLGPEIVEQVIGTALVKEVFSAGKAGKAAGCQVTEGSIQVEAKARIMRDNVILYTGQIGSLRRFKDDVPEVRNGLECGMTFENFADIKPGDEVQVYKEEQRERVI
ncbi:MAG: translation initiation factor IF-2 [Pseudomonadota bacterium]